MRHPKKQRCPSAMKVCIVYLTLGWERGLVRGKSFICTPKRSLLHLPPWYVTYVNLSHQVGKAFSTFFNKRICHFSANVSSNVPMAIGISEISRGPPFSGGENVSFREGGYSFYFAAEFLCCRYLREESEHMLMLLHNVLNAMIDVCNMFHL